MAYTAWWFICHNNKTDQFNNHGSSAFQFLPSFLPYTLQITPMGARLCQSCKFKGKVNPAPHH